MYKTKLSGKLMLAIFVALHFWVCNVRVYAQADGGDCTTVHFEISLFGIAIKPGVLLESPIEIEMHKTKGVISHTEHPVNSKQYLAFEYDPDSEMVLIHTTDEFLMYEKDQTETQLTTFISLECANNKKTDMGIIFGFEKVNNFAPEFNQPSYEIEIPLPLPTGLDIILLLSERISATDYDLYNNKIRFTSDLTAPFSVGTSSVTADMGKTYFATLLTTEKVLKIKNGMEFKIRALDAGLGTPRYTEAVVKFIVPEDYKELVEVPLFAKSLYKGIIDFHKTPPLEIETISLLNDTFIPSIAFEMELGDDTYFEVNKLENAVKIKLKDTVTENDLNGETNKQFTFVVRATRPDGISGNTAAIINIISKQQEESLLFENTLYTGTIKSDMTIDHVPIKLTDATYQSDVEFFITEDYWGIFDVIFEPNVNEMRIVLLRPVSDYELLDTSLVSLNLLARRAGNNELSGKSLIVLGIEGAEGITNAFEKRIYSGYFKRSSGDDSFQLEPLLLLRTPVNVGFKLSGEDTHLIKIHRSLENGIILGLVENITIEDTGGRTVLSVIVSAILTDTVIVSTVVLIHVDQVPESCELTMVVSIIILVAILLISGTTIFVMWWKWIRPYRYVKSNSWNEQLENDFNDAGYTEPVVGDIITKRDADLIGNSNFEIKNENGPSSPAALANSLQSVLKNYDNHKMNLVLERDTEPVNSEMDDSQPKPKEQKKFIKFNETVERIDIVDNFNDKESTSL